MRYYLLFGLLILVSAPAFAQDSMAGQKLSYEISMLQHAVGVPFTQYWKSPVNPGFSVGINLPYRTRKRRLSQGFDLGYYYHQNLNQALWLKTDWQYRFLQWRKWSAEANLGLGLMRDWSNYKTFRFDRDSGLYTDNDKEANYSVFASSGFGVGFSGTCS